ncbi:adhesin [Vibrio aestuarianus]|uniref:adhesin n=1 Tax=Vibrio aestuarianus TaxID=28171 RepID=UPI00237C5940|nr:adhesin [Vibrio aestuarianus]MDE1351306.1 adhesin [Vibrio aestuarianus]
MQRTLLIGCIALALSGCGTDSDTTLTSTQTGVFLDSPVAGLNYRTASISAGVTNENGEFKYQDGETVTFYIGDLTFPPVTATGQVTPADLGGGLSTTTTVNILQLLQSLDQDGDPDNGITILDTAQTAFVGTGLDLTSSTFDTSVSAILTSIGKTLVTEDTAKAHFTSSLKGQLKGSWLFSEGEGKRNILTFFDDNHYIIVHEHSDINDPIPGDQTAGSAEYGTYAFDLATNKLSLTVIEETDNSGGLCDDFGSAIWDIKVTNTDLSITLSDDDDEEVTVAFQKVKNAENQLVGAWLYKENYDDSDDSNDNDNILTILSDSEYVIVHTRNDYVDSGVLGEFAPYSYSGTTFTIGNPTVNADGDGGLSDIGGSANVTVSDTELSFNGAESFSFTRIQ